MCLQFYQHQNHTETEDATPNHASADSEHSMWAQSRAYNDKGVHIGTTSCKCDSNARSPTEREDEIEDVAKAHVLEMFTCKSKDLCHDNDKNFEASLS